MKKKQHPTTETLFLWLNQNPWITGICMSAILLFSAVACSDTSTSAPEAEPGLTLDLNTLQAHSPHGILQAEPLESAHVGQVNDDLLIGFTIGKETETGEPRSIVAYLCDGEFGEWLVGEADSDGAVTLANLDAYDDSGSSVVVEDVTIDGGTVSGTVTLWDENPQPFTTAAATGDAGLYLASKTIDNSEEEFVAGWVVLSDGRQQGLGAAALPAIIICIVDPEACIMATW